MHHYRLAKYLNIQTLKTKKFRYGIFIVLGEKTKNSCLNISTTTKQQDAYRYFIRARRDKSDIIPDHRTQDFRRGGRI